MAYNGALKKITTSFKWVISMDDLKNLKINEKVLSPLHISEVQATWQLSINKKIDRFDNTYKCYISLTLLQGNIDNTICSISFMNNDDVVENVFSQEHSFKGHKSLNKSIEYIIKNDDIKLFSYDELTVHCRILLLEKNIKEYKENKKSFSQFYSIFKDKKSSDLTVEVVKKYYLHKKVLAAGSPDFASILVKTNENNQNKLQLELDDEVSPGSVEDFFEYLYSNVVDFYNDDITRDLLILADKYDVKELKSQCEKYLSSYMVKSEALKTLIYGIKGNSQYLKKNTMKYMSKRLDIFMKHENFKTYMMENPNIFYEIVKMNLDI